MTTRQLPRRFHVVPANGTVITVFLELVCCSHWVVGLHVLYNPQVVLVLFDTPLNLIEEITQLHQDHQAGHREEYVAPQQHMKIMTEIDGKCCQLKAQLSIVDVGSTVLPHFFMMDIPQVNPIPDYHVQSTHCDQRTLSSHEGEGVGASMESHNHADCKQAHRQEQNAREQCQ
uniref:Putative secreted protein n=1 Tax=Ixodes ricinus TaxID=34613 RepID=A0A6B0UZ62_IXORI